MFTVGQTFQQDRYSFNIYNHNLTMDELDCAISEIIFENEVLTYLFAGVYEKRVGKERNAMLRRFIPEEFRFREQEVLNDWHNQKMIVVEGINNNKGYYSFFAEALMAYLNLEYLDNKLTFGVIGVDETLVDQHSGVDSCMYSHQRIVLGEAKFYQNFTGGKNKIIEDFNSNSLMNKIKSLYSKTINSKIIVKNVLELETEITLEEFMKYKKNISGFILHNQSNSYDYSNITDINQIDIISDCDIIFYHLPINDKKELIFKVIKKAMELIVYETEQS